MTLTWRTASVELVGEYTLTGADGRPTPSVDSARIAVEGGFLHVDVPGVGGVQMVSAPAVLRLVYATEPDTVS